MPLLVFGLLWAFGKLTFLQAFLCWAALCWAWKVREARCAAKILAAVRAAEAPGWAKSQPIDAEYRVIS